ncbi:MAG: VCBS repeat-containing protein, partial [Bacteroidota bacterium]
PNHNQKRHYDLDGDLDMYLLNHSFHDVNSYTSAQKRENSDDKTGDRLYENLANEGKQQFVDVTAKAGIYSSHLGYGLGIGVSDINGDHWPDIYVSNDFHENDYLYINQQDGTFKEKATESFGHQTRFSMGNDIADLNKDGKPDIFTLDMMPYDHEVLLKSAGEDKNKVSQIKKLYGYHDQYSRNAFQLNKGNDLFVDIATMSGTYATDWSWSPLIADFDNDGINDLFIANGIFKRPNDLDFINFKSDADYRSFKKAKKDSISQRIIDGMPSGHLPNIIYWGTDDQEFVKNEFSQKSFSNGAAYGDLDNDGDLDLVSNNINEIATVLRNNAGKNYIKVKLNGPELNPFAIGAKVTVFANGDKTVKELFTARGFQSTVSSDLVFGLGDATTVDSLEVIFEGRRKVVAGTSANALLTIDLNGLEDFNPVTFEKTELNSRALPFRHKEDKFFDYEQETLIPFSLSRKGPAIAVGDYNQDGNDDFYVGGAHDQAGKLFVQVAGKELFREVSQPVFERDSPYEDVDASFLDIDDDKDLDLVVISGGGRYRNNDLRMKHRLYLNEGGRYKRDPSFNAFQSNGSCLKPFDFDDDGDLDVFIGSQSVNMQYGVDPVSYILKNDGNGKMEKVSIPGLTGMISDAVWTDFDQDGDHDLIVVGLWMKPKLFENNEGQLTWKQGEFSDDLYGWWNCIESEDLDNDGKPDLVLGNFGLNSLIRVSTDEPMTLYLDDFDKNGRLDPVIFRYFNGTEIPLFPKDDLAEQLPYLKKKFQQYSAFSKISSPEELLGVPVKTYKQVNTLASIIILNDKTVIELPREAQRSTINDVAIADINGDQKNDLLMVGNYETLIANFGKLDANSGSILLGDGQGNFSFQSDLPLKPFQMHNKIRPVTVSGGESWIVGQNNGELVIIDPE